jgi:hypothetical protein
MSLIVWRITREHTSVLLGSEESETTEAKGNSHQSYVRMSTHKFMTHSGILTGSRFTHCGPVLRTLDAHESGPPTQLIEIPMYRPIL